MKHSITRLEAFLLVVFILAATVCLMPPSAEAESTADKMNSFISDSRWKNGTSWIDTQRPKLTGYSCSGCYAYSHDFMVYVYGKGQTTSIPSNAVSSDSNSVSGLRAGDIVNVTQINKYATDHQSAGLASVTHWFCVLSNNNGKLKTAEGNVLVDNKRVVRVSTSAYKVSGGKLIYNDSWYGGEYTRYTVYHFPSYGVVPKGRAEELKGGVGTISCRGWVFDADDSTFQVPIHMYVGGKAGSGAPCYVIQSGIYRPDVNSVYPEAGKFGGFDETVEVMERGTQQVYLYAINNDDRGGGNPLIKQAEVTIFDTAAELNKPVVSNVSVSAPTLESYQISFKAVDDTEVAKIRVITQATSAGGSEREHITAVRPTEDGTYSAEVKIQNYDKWVHTFYHSKIVVTDIYNNETVVSESSVPALKVWVNGIFSSIEITDLSSTGYTVVASIDPSYTVQKVSFPTWTEKNGKDDLISDWNNNAVGSLSGNTAVYRVDTTGHNHEKGLYFTHVYVTDQNGVQWSTSQSSFPQLAVDVPSPLSNIRITDQSAQGYTITCDLDENWGAVRAACPTWTLQNGKDDLVKNWAESPLTKGTISDGKLTYRVNTADHNNELECEYRTDIYLYDSQDRACNSAVEIIQAECKTVLDLPAGIKVIEEEAFMKNEIVEKVVIPSGCESIGPRAFADCASLYVVRIPASVVSIDASAFSGCGNVTVYTPAGSPAETWANQHKIKVVND